jgi:hypothetical protein
MVVLAVPMVVLAVPMVVLAVPMVVLAAGVLVPARVVVAAGVLVPARVLVAARALAATGPVVAGTRAVVRGLEVQSAGSDPFLQWLDPKLPRHENILLSQGSSPGTTLVPGLHNDRRQRVPFSAVVQGGRNL